MELIGRILRRKIYYLKVRNNSNWQFSLPKNDWIVFTIANVEDEELFPPAVKICIDKNVTYTCSAGNLSHLTELYFDEEITYRAMDYEMRTKKDFDYNLSPITTAHQNFHEGFWFAITCAHHEFREIETVVCLDFTKRKVKNQLAELIKQINNGWLPNDDDIANPKYDD